MSDLLIPDVSEFQGVINWPNFGAQAVIVRVNYGNVKVDGEADRNIDGARSKCEVRGWYTYLTAGEDPVAQADVLVRVINAHGGLKPNEFVVCDDEEGSGDQSSRVTAFLNEVDAQFKASDAIDVWYSGLNFSVAHNLDAAKGHRWIAAYGQSEPTAPHDLWQFTDAGSVAGVSGNVDMSVFHGTIDQLAALIGGSTSTAPPPAPSNLVWTPALPDWVPPYVSGADMVVDLGTTCKGNVVPGGTWYQNNTAIGVPQAGQFVEWKLANRVGGVWYDMDESGGPNGSPVGLLPPDQAFWITDSSVDTNGCGGTDPLAVAKAQNATVFVLGPPPVPVPPPPPPPPVPTPNPPPPAPAQPPPVNPPPDPVPATPPPTPPPGTLNWLQALLNWLKGIFGTN